MNKIIIGLILWAFCSFAAFAQNPIVTLPNPVASTNDSSTISVTNTFQALFTQNSNTTVNTLRGRTGCTIVNYGTHTMYVFFGPIANATLTNSIQLAANQPVYCASFGNVLTDQVSITGTSGDAFFAAQQ
jgi:hypothetical protein